MKNHFLTRLFLHFSIAVFFFSCSGNPQNADFQLKGKLTNSSGGYISLVDVNSQEMKTIDSVLIDENGEFIFTTKVPEKGFYSLQTSKSNFATIILDSSEHGLFEGDAKKLSEGYKMTGSKDSETLVKFNGITNKNFSEIEKVRYAQDSILRAFEAFQRTTNDSLELVAMSKQLEPVFNSLADNSLKLMEETGVFIRKFIDENASSFASLAAVQLLNIDRDIKYYLKVSEALTSAYPLVENLKDFKAYVDSKKTLAYGMPAPEITMNDRNGKPVSLSSLKGKVVLIDFWASWCGPCRADNPFVVDSIYHKYKDKGLDIFSVSLDKDRGAWLKAIEKDKLTWKNHVSDLKQWQSPVVALYQFNEIPFTIVLDREGNIAGKKLRGPALEQKIKELVEAGI